MALAQKQPSINSQASNATQSNVALGLPEFRRISKIMQLDAGITMPDDKVNLVHARLQKRLRALQIRSFKEYCAFVEDPSGREERKIMMNALTTNLTRFFREPHHFKHLLDVALPPLVEQAKNGGRVRIWSAGCSTGEEAYSIAAILHSIAPDIRQYDLKILASDIDSNVIRTGHAALYNQASVQKLPPKVRERYFKQLEDDPTQFSVSEELKALVSFRLFKFKCPRLAHEREVRHYFLPQYGDLFQ